MTPTIIMVRGKYMQFPSERDAYLFLVKMFIRIKPDIFTDPNSAHVCKGRQGTIYFAPSRHDIQHQPERVANNWWANLCLSNDQKVCMLDKLAQCVGWKRGKDKDWDWRAEHRETREFIDVDALFAELDRMPTIPREQTLRDSV